LYYINYFTQLNSCQSIDQKDKQKINILEEKYKLSESNSENIKEQYEGILKTKNDRIRELELENEILKKKLHTSKPSINTVSIRPNLDQSEISSPLTDISNKSVRRRRQNSEYMVSLPNFISNLRQ
jgi:hypothetical protein